MIKNSLMLLRRRWKLNANKSKNSSRKCSSKNICVTRCSKNLRTSKSKIKLDVSKKNDSGSKNSQQTLKKRKKGKTTKRLESARLQWKWLRTTWSRRRSEWLSSTLSRGPRRSKLKRTCACNLRKKRHVKTRWQSVVVAFKLSWIAWASKLETMAKSSSLSRKKNTSSSVLRKMTRLAFRTSTRRTRQGPSTSSLTTSLLIKWEKNAFAKRMTLGRTSLTWTDGWSRPTVIIKLEWQKRMTASWKWWPTNNSWWTRWPLVGQHPFLNLRSRAQSWRIDVNSSLAAWWTQKRHAWTAPCSRKSQESSVETNPLAFLHRKQTTQSERKAEEMPDLSISFPPIANSAHSFYRDLLHFVSIYLHLQFI